MPSVYVDYVKMTEEQQRQVKQYLLTKSLTEALLPELRFLVKEDGNIDRRKGIHTFTEERLAQLNAASSAAWQQFRNPVIDLPQKGGIRHWISAKFSVAKG